ncbi:hypothetical protein HZA38_04335 [Candidatus Peregrinibacteria bacterium]|nr:hypothetical protein [Candidatus Peregrinibacteria bacterium]
MTISPPTDSALMNSSIDLEKVLNEFFLILSEKEQTVITRRFALDSKPKQTLEKIGKHFSVTRERIRQIENIALQKLRRNIGNTQLQRINKFAKEILLQNGGVIREETLIAALLNSSHVHRTPVTGSIIKLGLTIDSEMSKIDTSKVFFPFWRHSSLPLNAIEKIASTNYKGLKKHQDLIAEKILIQKTISALKEMNLTETQVISVLSIDRRFRKMEHDRWGLMEWRHVNPKSIRDKANIILKKTKTPMHFIEIANRISQTGFDKKVVTVQAVHNDLIRYPEFVLVGRGVYALSEWGYEAGTVADIIAKILREKGPLKKKDIVSEVLKQRDVKLGTISLNLQKNPAFVRVGRAVYSFENEKWEKPQRGRGRAKMKEFA